jgi:hypothetical protein
LTPVFLKVHPESSGNDPMGEMLLHARKAHHFFLRDESSFGLLKTPEKYDQVRRSLDNLPSYAHAHLSPP